MSIVKTSEKRRDVKVVVLGDSGAGKTALLRRFIENLFDDENPSTIGIDFQHKTYILDDNTAVRLQIWDTAGQEKFRHLAPSYIREASVAVIVFDSTDANASESIRRWYHYVQTWKSCEIHVVLVASKCDKATKRTIPPEGLELMKFGGIYIETSAKTGDNIETVGFFVNND
ncbi:unnamed protein product [Auanema sp. JU1783]|nr:unnamed protein product [Auanema sp. JU1783]